jgi:type I restriction-modification system DNA methylase subunit
MSPQGAKALEDRRSRVLFIDARAMGTMVDKTERAFTDQDLEKISDTYHVWRGTKSAKDRTARASPPTPLFPFSQVTLAHAARTLETWGVHIEVVGITSAPAASTLTGHRRLVA